MLKKFPKIKSFVLVLVLLLIAMFILIFFPYRSFLKESVSSSFTLPLQGYERVDISVNGNVINLVSGCLVLSASTTFEQAGSVERALSGEEDFRPNSHDLFMHTLEEFDVKVLAVKIEELRDHVYYAKLIMQHGNKILNLDSRPSDAIAVALRVGSPIYVKRTLLADFGRQVC